MGSIEEDIKQSRPFSHVEEKALVNIMYTNGWVMEHLRSIFKPYGITNKQYNILRILRGAEEPISTSTIRNRMIDKMSDTTRLIDRMIKKGWVEKKICSDDRRLVDVIITDAGLAKLEEMEHTNHKVKEIFKKLTEAEVLQLSELLDKLRY